MGKQCLHDGSPKMPCGKSLRLSSSTAANLAHNRCSMHSEHTLTRAHLTDHQIRTADATDAQEQWLLFDQNQKQRLIRVETFERQKHLQKILHRRRNIFLNSP